MILLTEILSIETNPMKALTNIYEYIEPVFPQIIGIKSLLESMLETRKMISSYRIWTKNFHIPIFFIFLNHMLHKLKLNELMGS